MRGRVAGKSSSDSIFAFWLWLLISLILMSVEVNDTGVDRIRTFSCPVSMKSILNLCLSVT